MLDDLALDDAKDVTADAAAARIPDRENEVLICQ
jgi:hypothetical protein